MAVNQFTTHLEFAAQSSFALRFFPLIVGFFSAQRINFVGEIYVGELIAVFYLFANIHRLKVTRLLAIFGLLVGIWAVCQLISDQINDTAIADSLKGVGAPILLISTVASLSIYFFQNIERLPSFLLGAYLGMIPEFIISPGEFFIYNPWKWGVGLVVVQVFSVYFTFFQKNRSNAALLVFVALFLVVGLINDSRSLSTFPIIGAVLYVGRNSSVAVSAIRFLKSPKGFSIGLMGAGLSFLLLNLAFTAIFSSNYVLSLLPEESALKFQTQSEGSYGILLGGRPEFLVSMDAFLDKPFLGHGSWPKDTRGYQSQLAFLVLSSGYAETLVTLDERELDLIPTHSYLMGAFVWAGLGGGVFWIFILWWIPREMLNHAYGLGFYFYFGSLAIVWDILFSPFGASSRWGAALYIAALYAYSQWLLNKRLVSKNIKTGVNNLHPKAFEKIVGRF